MIRIHWMILLLSGWSNNMNELFDVLYHGLARCYNNEQTPLDLAIAAFYVDSYYVGETEAPPSGLFISSRDLWNRDELFLDFNETLRDYERIS